MILMWGGSILTLWDGKGGCPVQVCIPDGMSHSLFTSALFSFHS